MCDDVRAKSGSTDYITKTCIPRIPQQALGNVEDENSNVPHNGPICRKVGENLSRLRDRGQSPDDKISTAAGNRGLMV